MMNADLMEVYKRLAKKWSNTSSPERDAARAEDFGRATCQYYGIERKSMYDVFLKAAKEESST